MFRPYPISSLQLGCFALVVIVGGIALIATFSKNRSKDSPSARSEKSRLGIALQAIAFGFVGYGPLRVSVASDAMSSLAFSAMILLLGGSGVAIFVAAARAMGKNWSVVARMRSDHELVRSGPFAVVRHPIYLALFLYFLSFGVAFGHLAQLVAGVPLYLAGTIVRVRSEERLLRAQFGDAHASYVREVPAFIPFLR